MRFSRRREKARAHIVLGVGDVLEVISAGLLIAGVWWLAGWGWAIVTSGIIAAIFAELLYYDTGIVLRQGKPNGLPDLPP